MKKFVVFLNGAQTRSVLHVKTQNNIVFPFIQKKTISDHDQTVIFAADNGFKKILIDQINYQKLFLFGDFDSLSATHLKKAKQSRNIELNILPKEKNISDFAAILDHIRANFTDGYPYYIEIYGALGKDKAHEFANIKECENFLKNSQCGGVIVLQSQMILSTLSFALTHKPNREFSLFSDPKVHFALHNCKYDGQIALTRPSHGISNYIKNSPLIVERTPSSDVITLIMR